MSSARAQRLELEAAERRVLEELRTGVEAGSSARRVALVTGAVGLFAATFAARLAIPDPAALIANFYMIPIALLAIEFGTRGGLLAAGAAELLVFAWGVIDTINVSPLGYTSRGAVFVITGTLVGQFSERLRHDIALRRRAQRHLSLYADELEHANRHLAESVERLEAFSSIARAVGGETDLHRVLSLILEHCQEIVAARLYVICLPYGDRLIALGAQHELELPLDGTLAGAVLLSGLPRRITNDADLHELDPLAPGARAAILVPLSFRGERLGVLVGIDRSDAGAFDQDDEQLLLSVAASAATAVATAQSVAAARLRDSLEAAEQARARWARELHDETLQALGDLGLGPAIETLARRQAAIGGFEVEVALKLEPGDRLAGETEGAIYRIAQEALSNIVKHAQAQHVQLQLERSTEGIEIAVRDDGCGFETDGATDGFGIAGMRERALLAGGQLSVSSEQGGPTCVTALLPLPPARIRPTPTAAARPETS